MKKYQALVLLTLISLLSACSNNNPQPVKPSGPKDIDVFIFMGQSNMAGRGNPDPKKWPGIVSSIKCEEGHAYEYRAKSDPTQLYPLNEPFGYAENGDGISDTKGDGGKKSGSLVSAFCESYYQKTNVPILAVSASEGGTSSAEWGDSNSILTREAKKRLDDALNFMYMQDDYNVRHINMVWLQGESDAGHFIAPGVNNPTTIISEEAYKQNTTNMVNQMKSVGVEKCFLITIGNYIPTVNHDHYLRYKQAHKAQQALCEENGDIILASIKLQDMPTTDGVWMHDNNHYFQNGYNIVGDDAGKNVAEYILTGKEAKCNKYTESDNLINQNL